MNRSIMLAALAASALAPASAAADALAIQGATVYVTPTQKLEGATVVVVDGRVAGVGVGVAVPAGATVIDGRGKVVTAGLIDAVSSMGQVEVGAEADTVDGAFGAVAGDPIHAAYRASDAYRTTSVAIPVARTGGVTSVITGPRGGLVSGQAAWVALGTGFDVRDQVIADPVAMLAQIGPRAAPGGRGAALEQLREVLDDTRHYARNRAAFEQRRTRDYAAGRLDLEALGQVLRRELPLVVRADRASDILALIRLRDELNLRVVIVGGAEAWMVAERLAKAGIAVVLDPAQNLPSSFDAIYVRNDGPALLAKAGVTVAISTIGEAHDTRTLRQRAGIAVAYGMEWPAALAAITAAPASIFGKPDAGTLARGSRADLVVWSGDPLELSTRAEHVVVGGVAQPLETRQTRLLERYRHVAAPAGPANR